MDDALDRDCVLNESSILFTCIVDPHRVGVTLYGTVITPIKVEYQDAIYMHVKDTFKSIHDLLDWLEPFDDTLSITHFSEWVLSRAKFGQVFEGGRIPQSWRTGGGRNDVDRLRHSVVHEPELLADCWQE